MHVRCSGRPMTPRVSWNPRDQCHFFKYRNAEGKRKTKNVPVEIQDKDKAQAWADTWFPAYVANGYQDPTWKIVPKEKVHTIRGLSDKWLTFRETHPKCKPTTWKGYNSITNNHILTHKIADMPISQVTPQVLRAWVQELNKKHAANTVHNISHVLTCFFKDARGEFAIKLDRNPMADEIVRDVLPPQANQAGRGLVIHVPLDDIGTILASTNPRLLPLRKVRHRLQVSSGMREGEVCGLIWEHVHEDAKIPHIVIEQQFNDMHEVAAPKKNSYRTLPLHPETAKALAWWRKVGWKMWIGKEHTSADPVFPSSNGLMTRPRSAEYLRYDLVLVGCKDTYKGHNLDSQSLRRTFGTMLKDSGAEEGDRKAMLGHAAANVTDKYYTHRNLHLFVPAIHGLNFPAWVDPVVSQPSTWGGNQPSEDIGSQIAERQCVYEIKSDESEGVRSSVGQSDLATIPLVKSPDGSRRVPLKHPITPVPNPGQSLPTQGLDPSNRAHVDAVRAWLTSLPRQAQRRKLGQ